MSCASCRPSWSQTRISLKASGDSTRLVKRSKSASRWRSTERAMDATVQPQPRHFLDLLELSTGQLRGILDSAAAIKAARVKGAEASLRPLAGKTLATIYDRPSTRTRVSFDVGMRELGGEAIMLTGAEMQLGRGETIADT